MSLLLLFLISFFTSLLIIYPLIWALKFFKLGQSIREEGPTLHKVKAGTPTMGGIGIICALFLLTVIFFDLDREPQYLTLILLTLAFAGVGLVDDILKVVRQENRGLTFWQKMSLQILIATLFTFFLLSFGHHQSVSGLLNTLGFRNGLAYFFLSVFIIVGSANATNLTDGLDGLLCGTATIGFLFFALLSQKLGFFEMANFSFLACGATLAFLFFNFPKAQAFMGDVGSLSLGAGLAGIALLVHQELRLILLGGVFVIEALSVIVQVTSYKLFKKRIFRMSPLHHHFELLGWSEQKIVITFWIAALIFGFISILG